MNKRDAILEDFEHRAQSLLDLQGGHRKTAEKEGQWTEVVRRNTKEPKRRGRRRQVMDIQNAGTIYKLDKHTRSMTSSGVPVVSPAGSAPSTNEDESD